MILEATPSAHTQMLSKGEKLTETLSSHTETLSTIERKYLNSYMSLSFKPD